MTPIELIQQLSTLPPNARISMQVTQAALSNFVQIQVNIEAFGLRPTLTQNPPKQNE